MGLPVYDLNLDEANKTLTIEWDNKVHARSSGPAATLTIFWFVWTGLTGTSIWILSTGRNANGTDHWMYLWILFGFLGVIFIPLRLLTRKLVERVEITPSSYRRFHPSVPKLLPCNWKTPAITKVMIGHNRNSQGEAETMVSLNVFKGWRRDLVAYWLDEEIKAEIFEELKKFFELLRHPAELSEDYAYE